MQLRFARDTSHLILFTYKELYIIIKVPIFDEALGKITATHARICVLVLKLHISRRFTFVKASIKADSFQNARVGLPRGLSDWCCVRWCPGRCSLPPERYQ